MEIKKNADTGTSGDCYALSRSILKTLGELIFQLMVNFSPENMITQSN